MQCLCPEEGGPLHFSGKLSGPVLARAKLLAEKDAS